MNKLPGISVQQRNVSVTKTATIPAIRVDAEPCDDYCNTSGRLPAIKVIGSCHECPDEGQVPDVISEDYEWITYRAALRTYTYTINWIYDGGFWIVVDNNVKFVGEPTSDDELLEMLNEMDLGVFTLDGTTITVKGYHIYGDILETDSDAPTVITPVVGCMNPSALDYNPNANVPGACTFAIPNTVTFNIASKKAVETQIGANLFERDVTKFAAWTAKTIELGLQMLYYTPITGMSNSHAATLVTMLIATGCDLGIFYPIRDNNTAVNFPTFYDWIKLKFGAYLTFVQLDDESQLKNKHLDTLNPPYSALYISRAQQVMNYDPAMQFSWDTAPIYRTTTASVNRNQALKDLNDTDWGRQYEQISPDRCIFSPTDSAHNLMLVNYYYDTQLPGDLVAFFALFTHITKQTINQFHNNDTGTTELSHPLRNYSIGRMAIFTLANTDKFANVLYMQLSELVRGVHPEFDSMKRIAKCFYFTYTMPVTIPYAGCLAQ